MANRILIGKRGTSDHGLYVSRPTEDVTSTSSGLMFSSDEAVKGFNVSARGQGILSPGASRTFSHGLGFRPFVEVTYTNAANMTGGNPTTAATFTANLTYNFFFGVYTVTSVTVNSGGSGYQTSPSLAFSPAGATATANISGGAVTSVTVTSGGFYTSTPPTVTPTGGGAIVYATKVYKAYNENTTPYDISYQGSTINTNVFEDVSEWTGNGQSFPEWNLDYEEGASYTTTTANLVINNGCKGGRYIEKEGFGPPDTDIQYSGQNIYYAYVIFNTDSPFI